MFALSTTDGTAFHGKVRAGGLAGVHENFEGRFGERFPGRSRDQIVTRRQLKAESTVGACFDPAGFSAIALEDEDYVRNRRQRAEDIFSLDRTGADESSTLHGRSALQPGSGILGARSQPAAED